MFANVNGKTVVTIKDQSGKFYAIDVSDTGEGFASEREALEAGINRILGATKEADERAAARALLDDDEYLSGKTNAQKAAILRAAKVLGRTVYLYYQRGEYDRRAGDDYEVKIVGTTSVGLKRLEDRKTVILRYEEIVGGFTNDPGTNE